MTPRYVIQTGEGFWNIRGSFKVGGVLDVGSRASLVRRKTGGDLLLDACRIDPATRAWLDGETRGGDAIDAVLHLHPFHTVFVRKLQALYPKAKLYGTARHPPPRSRALVGAVPRGVELIPQNERLHFSSVLAFHPASRTVHVHDTLNYVRLPWPLRAIKPDVLGFHSSLKQVLEKRAGAARDFREWARELALRMGTTENLCAAHTSVLLGRDGGAPLHERVAARKLEPKLNAHERRFG